MASKRRLAARGRLLVAAEAARGECFQRRRIDRQTWSWLHIGDDDFSPFLVGDADHSGLEDRRITGRQLSALSSIVFPAHRGVPVASSPFWSGDQNRPLSCGRVSGMGATMSQCSTILPSATRNRSQYATGTSNTPSVTTNTRLPSAITR